MGAQMPPALSPQSLSRRQLASTHVATALPIVPAGAQIAFRSPPLQSSSVEQPSAAQTFWLIIGKPLQSGASGVV
jgi:hypothetical protein